LVVVALEGGVCAGKSSVAARFGSEAAYQIIDDYTSFIDDFEYSQAEQLPAAYRYRFFLRLDEARRARTICGPTNVVVDRSVFTILAYEYALWRLGRISELQHINQISNFYTLLPNSVVFLEVSDDERRRRAALRTTKISPILLDDKFNALIREFFKKFSKFYDLPIIDTTDLGISDVYAICRNHMANARSTPITVSLLLRTFQEQ
jgi:thymidylate kinase